MKLHFLEKKKSRNQRETEVSMTHQDTATSFPHEGSTPEKPSQTVPRPERIKQGYSLRKDLIRKCKQIALDEDRRIYEVIEEGLELVIAKHQQKNN